MKKGWIWALGALATLVVLAVVGIALLSSTQITTAAAKAALDKFSSQIPAHVTFGHLSVSPLQGRIAVDDINVSLPNKPSEKLFKAKQIIVDIDLFALASRKVHVKKLHLVDPDATIIHRGNNHYNVQDLLPKDDHPQQPNNQASLVTLSELSIDGGHVTYLDAPRHISGELPHIKSSLALDLDKKYVNGGLSLSNGWVNYEGHKQPIDSFLADGKLDGKNVTINKLQLDAGETNVAVRGNVGGLGDADQTLGLDGLVKTRLQQWAGIAKQPITGQAQVDFQVKGSVKEPQVAAQVSGQQLGYKALRVALMSTHVTATRQTVKVAGLKADLWDGHIAGNATVPLEKGARLDADVKVSDLDLAAAVKQLEVKGAEGLKGKASASVRASGDRLTPDAVVASGWLKADGSYPVNGRQLPLAARTDFRWDAGQLDVTRLDASVLGGHIRGEGRAAPLAKKPSYAVTAHIDDVAVAEVERLTGKPLPVTGVVGGDVTVHGDDFKHPDPVGEATVTARGALKAGQAGAKAPLPYDASARVALQGREVTIQAAHVAALNGTADATGTVNIAGSKPVIHVQAQAHHIDLAAVDHVFQVQGGRLAGTVDASIAMNDQTVDIRSVDAHVLKGEIKADGRVLLEGKQPSYAVAVHAHKLDIGTATRMFRVANVPVRGSADADVRVSGTGAHFSASGPIAARGEADIPAQAGGRPATTLPFRMTANVDGGARGVKLLPLELHVAASSVTARGALNLDSASDLTVHGRVVDMGAIAAVFGVKDLSGANTTLDAHAAGQPGHVTMTAHLVTDRTSLGANTSFQRADLTLAGYLASRLHLTGALKAQNVVASGETLKQVNAPLLYDAPAKRLGGGNFAVNGLDVAFAGGHFGGKASFDLAAKAYAADLRTRGLTLKDFQPGGTPGATQKDPNASGAVIPGSPIDPATAVSLSFAGTGTVAHPGGTAKVNLAGFDFKGNRFGATALTAKLANDAVALSGGIFGNELGLSGSLPLKTNAAGRLVLRFNNVHLAPLMALAQPALANKVELPVDGQLAGQIALTGPISSPQRMTADVNLTRLRVAFHDMELDNQGPIQLTYADRAVLIKALHVKGEGTDVSAHGRIGLGTPSDFGTDGSLNLALLEKLSPQNFADASGTARLEASLQGTLGHPDMVGSMTVRQAELNTRNLPQTIRDLNASVRLDHNRVFLDRLRATLGYTGRIDAYGGATLGADFMPKTVSLQATGRELAIRIPDTNALLDADLAFSGTPESSRLDGVVKVLEARYTKDIPLTASALLARKHSRSGPDLAKIPFVKNLQMQVQVQAPGQIIVKDNLADMELRGDLAVVGTPAVPGVVGRVETLPGAKVMFQDRTYDVQEASVDFVDPAAIKPYIHLVADTTIQSVDVNLAANGTPEALKLDLKSTPYMPQSDVLTLLATGQTPSQLAQGSGNSGSAVSNLLVNQVAGGLEHSLTGESGAVDVLRIQPGSTTGTEQATGGSLTVGKRINDRLMISYAQDLGNTPGQVPGRQIIFDYTLTDFLVLNLQQDLSGSFNASARYRFPIR